MKLLDAATVTTGTGNWTRGWDGDSRACAGVSVYLSECDPAVTQNVIGDSDSDDVVEACGYRVIPFAVHATLKRSTRNELPDDGTWLAQALRDSAELPVARGLLVRQGTVGDTWLGNPSIEGIASPATDAAATAAAVSEARKRFFAKTIGLEPLLHVSPDGALRLRNAGVLQLDPVTGDDRTVWGDAVVISPGYYDVPGMTATPLAWYTGPIEITLSQVSEEEIMRFLRGNQVMHQVTMIVAIDTMPCAIVRVGPAPTPA